MTRRAIRGWLRSRAVAVSALLATSACSGSLGGTTDGVPGSGAEMRPPGDGPQTRPGTSPPASDPNAAATIPLRLITRAEYDNTISVIFGDEYKVVPAALKPATVLPGETVDLSGFLSVGEVSDMHVQRYGDAAAAVTAAIGPSLSRLTGCDLAKATEETTCLRRFIGEFGELLYRRPLAPKEVDEHFAFYDYERKTLAQDPTSAARALVEAMLQSPHFLYRWEEGWKVAARKGNVVRLNPYQIASRLSFFLWGSGPDRALIALAKAGQLATPEQIVAQARKMLESPRAARALDSFHNQWLGLGDLPLMAKDKNRFPRWNETLATTMAREIETFARSVLLESTGTLGELLTAPYSFVNADLASVYGLTGVQGAQLRKVQLDPKQRAGLLTMPGFLAAASEPSAANPFRRGKLVLDKILCQSLEPPAEIPMPPAPSPNDPRSERQVLEELTGSGSCASCHRALNPLGFGLGNFDAIGQFVTKDEHGKPVDAAGTLPETGVAFAGPVELAGALAQDDRVRACLVNQWFRFALARQEEKEDAHSIRTAYQAFTGAKDNLRELLVALVATPSFYQRSLEAQETVEVLP